MKADAGQRHKPLTVLGRGETFHQSIMCAFIFQEVWERTWFNQMRCHVAQTLSPQEAGASCGRWYPGGNSSCRLPPAEEGKINRAKWPVGGKTRNGTENTELTELCLFFWWRAHQMLGVMITNVHQGRLNNKTEF